MLKKACVILLALSHSAFANNTENSSAYKEPKYKISEIDMKILIHQLNNIEQCIYPELSKPDYEKVYKTWDLAESFAMKHFEFQILQELLGEKNFYLMQQDTPSMEYFNALFNKLNHQKANVDKERCEAFKITYQKVYEDVKDNLSRTLK